jgi:hypothetical protein
MTLADFQGACTFPAPGDWPRCSTEDVSTGKDRLWSILSMLVGLIKANYLRDKKPLTAPIECRPSWVNGCQDEGTTPTL